MMQMPPTKVPNEHSVQVKMSVQALQLGMHSTQAAELARFEKSRVAGRGAMGGCISTASPTVRAPKLVIEAVVATPLSSTISVSVDARVKLRLYWK